MDQEISQQVIETAADVFCLPEAEVSTSSSPQDIANWDSMQHLNLVLALEEAFSLQFQPEEIEAMKSIQDIVNIIENRLKESPES